ncbi:MAG: OmpA family protein [Candidatus Kryptoniota bacterium]
MARVKVEAGGKALAGIVILGVVLFLFFRIKGSASNQTPPAYHPPAMAAQQPISSQHAKSVQHEIPSPGNEMVHSKPAPVEKPPQSEGQSRNEPAFAGEPLPKSTLSKGPIKIFFDFNRTSINKNVYCIFDRIEEAVVRNNLKNLKIVVEGNADAIGPSWYNIPLSRRRAARVADSLSRRLGIPMSEIELIANGSTKPLASNKTPDGRAENRRTEVMLYH